MRSIKHLVNWYFSKEKFPYWGILLLDCFIIYLVYVFVYGGYFSLYYLIGNLAPLTRTSILYIIITVVFFKIFHTYSGILRFSSFVDLQRLGIAMLSSAIVIIPINYFIRTIEGNFFTPLLTRYLLAVLIISTFLMWAVRLSIKFIYDTIFRIDGTKRVLIYGDENSMVGLAKHVRSEKPSRFNFKGFICDGFSMKHNRIMGAKVYCIDDNLTTILKKERIEAVLVAPLQNDKFRHDERLQNFIINAGVQIYMSSAVSLWNKSETPELKEVSIEDLLPREQISIDMESIGKFLSFKKILITGSAGSIGSEIVRQICKYNPAELILIDQAETPQHDIRLMLAKEYPEIKAQTIVTSIVNIPTMEHIFKNMNPDLVFHAAAYKHVPMMEDNPAESVQSNIYGTKMLADLSVKYGVERFVMISTDKAVNPSNVMGCSKRICEMYVQSLNSAELSGRVSGRTHFITTRFGNVLGSNGSVIPLFKEQIRLGGPVTVTSPDIVRYFMLISEASKLVLEAGAKGKGGEIFVFDMGKPVKIADLAKRMILLSGAKDIKINFIGLRDGEKLYEEVLSAAEHTMPSFHEKIRIASTREVDYDTISKEIDELVTLSYSYDDMKIVGAMKKIVPEYKSANSVYESLDK